MCDQKLKLWTLTDDGLNYLESDRFLDDLQHAWYNKHADYVEVLVRNLPLYPNVREELEYNIKTAFGLNKFSSDFPKYKLVLVAHDKLKWIPKATAILRFDFPRLSECAVKVFDKAKVMKCEIDLLINPKPKNESLFAEEIGSFNEIKSNQPLNLASENELARLKENEKEMMKKMVECSELETKLLKKELDLANKKRDDLKELCSKNEILEAEAKKLKNFKKELDEKKNELLVQEQALNARENAIIQREVEFVNRENRRNKNIIEISGVINGTCVYCDENIGDADHLITCNAYRRSTMRVLIEACCEVCMDGLLEIRAEDLRSLPCGHIFCDTCIQGVVASQQENHFSSTIRFPCPKCRQIVKSNDIKRLYF